MINSATTLDKTKKVKNLSKISKTMPIINRIKIMRNIFQEPISIESYYIKIKNIIKAINKCIPKQKL
jgi:hypothetical protein